MKVEQIHLTPEMRKLLTTTAESIGPGPSPNDAQDAARYRKLRGWMSSNVPEGWNEVERMGALAAWESWEAMDGYLDGLQECTVGLMSPPSSPLDA